MLCLIHRYQRTNNFPDRNLFCELPSFCTKFDNDAEEDDVDGTLEARNIFFISDAISVADAHIHPAGAPKPQDGPSA